MPFPSRSILVSGEAYGKLAILAAEMKKNSGKSVTFGEVVEKLLETSVAFQQSVE